MKESILPKCKDCIHFKERVVSEIVSILYCDLPNGNRKASKDVGCCDNFERKM